MAKTRCSGRPRKAMKPNGSWLFLVALGGLGIAAGCVKATTGPDGGIPHPADGGGSAAPDASGPGEDAGHRDAGGRGDGPQPSGECAGPYDDGGCPAGCFGYIGNRYLPFGDCYEPAAVYLCANLLSTFDPIRPCRKVPIEVYEGSAGYPFDEHTPSWRECTRLESAIAGALWTRDGGMNLCTRDAAMPASPGEGVCPVVDGGCPPGCSAVMGRQAQSTPLQTGSGTACIEGEAELLFCTSEPVSSGAPRCVVRLTDVSAHLTGEWVGWGAPAFNHWRDCSAPVSHWLLGLAESDAGCAE